MSSIAHSGTGEGADDQVELICMGKVLHDECFSQVRGLLRKCGSTRVSGLIGL